VSQELVRSTVQRIPRGVDVLEVVVTPGGPFFGAVHVIDAVGGCFCVGCGCCQIGAVQMEGSDTSS